MSAAGAGNGLIGAQLKCLVVPTESDQAFYEPIPRVFDHFRVCVLLCRRRIEETPSNVFRILVEGLSLCVRRLDILCYTPTPELP